MAATLAAQDPVKPLPPLASQELPTGIRWKLPLSAAPAHPPLIAGERVFVSVLPGQVAAYDLKDHRELWREALNPDQAIAAEGDRLFVVSDEAVHAVNAADCSKLWRTPTGKLTAPLLVKDGWIIAASADKLFALRAADGEVIWSKDSGPQRERPAISGDLLFVPVASGSLRALALTTGEIQWQRPFGGAPAEPLIVGDSLYVGVTDKHFYSINARNGKDEESPIRVGTIVRTKAASDGKWVFFAGLDNMVRAIDRSDGAYQWMIPVKFRPFEGPRMIGSSVAIVGPSLDIVLLDIRHGTAAGKISFPEPLALAPAFGTKDGTVVVAGISGGLTQAWTLWLASPGPPTPH